MYVRVDLNASISEVDQLLHSEGFSGHDPIGTDEGLGSLCTLLLEPLSRLPRGYSDILTCGAYLLSVSQSV
jgi:hypothetical protein